MFETNQMEPRALLFMLTAKPVITRQILYFINLINIYKNTKQLQLDYSRNIAPLTSRFIYLNFNDGSSFNY